MSLKSEFIPAWNKRISRGRKELSLSDFENLWWAVGLGIGLIGEVIQTKKRESEEPTIVGRRQRIRTGLSDRS